uniref:CCHC-type domain-containing protein n=1 Tax=Musca domestica TaxID=7370 RepID=A0A1I8NJL5_MUSDO
MPKITSLKVDTLKRLLRERKLDTMGKKSELVERLSRALGSDEVECEDIDGVEEEVSIQSQINTLKDMMENVMLIIQQQRQVTTPIVDLPANESSESKVNESALTQKPSYEPIQRTYSVQEMAEILPEYDPTKDSTFGVEQFIDRVEKAAQAYECEETLLLLAVYRKLKGPAKLWLDSTPEFFGTWNELANALMEEFSTNADEADIHFKMTSTVRRQDESISEYCFRMSALGRRYGISETAAVKYTRAGLKHRELQQAIAPIRFRTMRGLREASGQYFASIANCSNRSNLMSSTGKRDPYTKEDVDKRKKADPKVMCYNCSEPGHISSQCPKPPRRERCRDCHKVHPKNSPTHCGRTETKTCSVRKVLNHKPVTINGFTYDALIDTGSECSMIHKTVAYKLGVDIRKCKLRISGVCGGTCVIEEVLTNKTYD